MALKLSKKQWWMIIGAIAVILLVWFAVRYYSPPAMSDIPLYSTEKQIALEADELQGIVDSLYSSANNIASNVISAALADNYLTMNEEKEIPVEIMSNVEILNSRIKYSAVVDGFSFSIGSKKVREVKGYKYDADMINNQLESQFLQKGTAVKERILIAKLNNLLAQNTEDDKWLDDKEKRIVVNYRRRNDSFKWNILFG